MSLLQSLLVLAVAICCLSSCTSRPAAEREDGKRSTHAAWMDTTHPGPFQSITPPGGEAERCITCHSFTEMTTVSDFLPADLQARDSGNGSAEPDPLSPGESHPGGWLAWHEPAATGCIACHGGTASGTSYSSAGHAQMFDNGAGLFGLPADASRELGCGGCHEGELLPGAPLLSEGRALIIEHNCSACHALPGWLTGAGGGPDLGRIGGKYPTDILATLPNHVQHYKPGSRMPHFSLTTQEAADIAAFISAGSAAELSAGDLPAVAGDDLSALQLLAQSRCVNCHTLPGLPAGLQTADLPDEIRQLWALPQGNIGPSLALVGERLDAAWIRDFLLDVHAHYPGSRMPQYELEEEEAGLLAGWLATAGRSGEFSRPEGIRQEGDPLAGETQFIANGCAGCHELGGHSLFGVHTGPTLMGLSSQPRQLWQGKAPHVDRLADYIIANLSDPAAAGNPRMPIPDLTEHERLAITTALLAEPAAGTARVPALRETPASANQPLKSDWQAYWDYPVPAQGSGDPALSRLERDLHPQSCAVCHRQQYSDWQGTRHSLAMGPGILGQIVDMDSANYSSCLKCHAVLTEQQHVRRLDGDWQDNPDYREDLYLTGISCASCHVRAHTRFAANDSGQRYPWDRTGLSAHPLERIPLLESSDFCWNCHQFDESRTIADGNPPLQNTNVEHREWQQATGDTRSCQDCHMPDGRHTFRGIHDADFLAESISFSAELTGSGRGRVVRLSIDTREVGHYFPTYVTPAVFVEVQLLDAEGRPLDGTQQSSQIRRDARTRRTEAGKSEWYDKADTRLPPGRVNVLEYEIQAVASAAQVHLLVRVEPDFFYHNSYSRWMEDDSRSAAGRGILRDAFEETSREVSGFEIFEASLELD